MIEGPPLNQKENRVFNKLQHVPGLVLAHGLGTGKTRTSIQVANKMNMPTDVVVPAALQDNYKKEMSKWLGGQPDNFHVESQQAAGRGGLKYNSPDGMMIVDEAHRARDYKSQLLSQLKKSQASKKLLLTATPVYNHPSDIAPLVNLASGQNLLPEDRQGFSDEYIKEKQVNPSLFGRFMGVSPGTQEVLTNTDKLKGILGKYVDYEEGNHAEGFPTSREETIKVPLTDNQQNIYKTIMNKAPFWVRWKVNAGLPPNKSELPSLQAFLTGARQVANSDWDFLKNKNNFAAPKAEAAAKYLSQQIQNNPRYKGVVYSNYLNSGLSPYKEYLNKYNIPYGEFSGNITPKVRDQTVRDYNANKLKALLISSAGAEGLDLKGTRLLQILEPHWNRAKERQIIGRAARYKSHDGLPQDEQNVLIQRYLAEPKAGLFGKLMGKETTRGTDEYINDMATSKDKLNDQMIDLIAQSNPGHG